MSPPTDQAVPSFDESWTSPRVGEQFVVDLDGFEGPLDVLLELARRQKVDLARISILALADQYLAFIGEARRVRIDLAADYLVMAAWLAYLKSRLLLPPEEQDEPTAEDLAQGLAFQLRRLQSMREAGERLFARPLLGRDVFAAGAPEGVPVERVERFAATLYELLSAYADHRRRREARTPLHIERPRVFTIEEALERLAKLVGTLPDWETLWRFLPAGLQDESWARSAVASTFVAGLELARQGRLQLRQFVPFGPLYVRRAQGPA
jgi:segregation and condensation protein A